MSYGIKLKVWGDYACFSRPEMKVERVSYDVITPSAARGILEAIYWKPEIAWVIDRIHVLKRIRFNNIRRNELSGKVPVGNIKKAMKNRHTDARLETFIEDTRQQRAAMVLRDVAYGIEAHFDVKSGDDDTPVKHKDMFERRAGKGQCFHQPYLGCREFPSGFELISGGFPESEYKDETEKDLGWMLHDIDFDNRMEAKFFRAVMRNGVIDVPLFRGKGVVG